MTDERKPASQRPPQVTLSGWMIMLGSAFVVLTAFDAVAGLRSLETREALQETLGQEPYRSLGIEVSQAQDLMHVSLLVMAGCATAAAVLGWHVLRRSKHARIALTVLVLPLFLTGIAAGGFLTAIVTVAVVTLWLQPARDWFAGRTWQEPRGFLTGGAGRSQDRDGARQPEDIWGHPKDGSPTGQQPDQPRPDPQLPPGYGDRPQPPPFQGFGNAPQPQAGQSQFGQPPYPGQPPYGAHARSSGRPSPVALACLLTWVGSGLIVAFFGLAALGALTVPQETLRPQIERDYPQILDAMSYDQMILSTLVLSGGLIAWAVAAAVLTLFVWRGDNWARVTLIVSSALVIVLSVTMAMAIAPLLYAGLGIAVIVMLNRMDATAWFGRARRHS